MKNLLEGLNIFNLVEERMRKLDDRLISRNYVILKMREEREKQKEDSEKCGILLSIPTYV